MKDSNAYSGPSFSMQNRMARVLWGFIYICLFRPSPRPLHSWRAFLLRCFGAKLGRNCHVYPRARIWAPWNLACGDEVGIGDDVIVYSQDSITLGSRAVISQGSHLCTGSHNYHSMDFELITAPIKVGDHAWICAECFIGPGVNIGEGAVVGARSVVMKDMPSWMVCAGHPCKPIKPRDRQSK